MSPRDYLISDGVSTPAPAEADDSLVPLVGKLPGEGTTTGEHLSIQVRAKGAGHEAQVRLKEKIGEGGEGAVFSTDRPGYVAKVYKRTHLTANRLAKLDLMIADPVAHAGICFPEALLLNEAGERVGYLMREARGHELGKSVFVPMLLHQKFPDWTRLDTIQLCLTLLTMIDFLHQRGIIIGDINPANILVVSPTEVYFVDCDSYQIGPYPCPVGTANFTPPEVIGKDYKTFLRTEAMERFAVATLLFMVMLPGKPPYSAVGGSSPAENIKRGNFAYPHLGRDGDAVPPGRWGFIWSHMSYRVRLAFFETFSQGQAHFAPSSRYSAKDWITLFRAYQAGAPHMVRHDPVAMDLFPTRVKRPKSKECRTCGSSYTPDPDNYRPVCDACARSSSNRRPRSQPPARASRPRLPPAVPTAAPAPKPRTAVCRNSTCGATFPLYRDQTSRRDPEYCKACWTSAKCSRCGYSAAKWMHDERNGLCRRCHATAPIPVPSAPSAGLPIRALLIMGAVLFVALLLFLLLV